MKRIFPLAFVSLILLAALTLFGCDAMLQSLQNYPSIGTTTEPSETTNPSSNNDSKKKYHQVTFIFNNNTEATIFLVEEGETVPTPTDPVKSNYLFRGWYTESSFINRYDFAQPVTADLKLYAKYEIDAINLTNKISTDTLKNL